MLCIIFYFAIFQYVHSNLSYSLGEKITIFTMISTIYSVVKCLKSLHDSYSMKYHFFVEKLISVLHFFFDSLHISSKPKTAREILPDRKPGGML